ncbi:MAG: S1 RNA-binding domain-containing protein, partial [Candidatus Kapaibacteriota bacterium]
MNENIPIASQTENQNPNDAQNLQTVQTLHAGTKNAAEQQPEQQVVAPQSDEPTTGTLNVEMSPITEQATSLSSQDTEKQTETEQQRRRSKRARLMQAFAEVKAAFQENRAIEVNAYSRVRGGLRVFYKEAPLFLPASHFYLKKSPTDEELLEVVGKNILVKIHEIQEYDEGSMAVIVSRKKLLEDEFWENIKVGQKVQGKICSIASFGVFIDLEGAEGLIHVSRLAPYRIETLKEHFKIGDT